IEQHLKMIGMLHDPELSPEQQQLIADKRTAYEAVSAKQGKRIKATADSDDSNQFPATATVCHKCNTRALMLLDGCQTCLSCGYSKCG
ncbi:MAG: NrdJb, partial [Xanthomonadales bacterium]|nr:NrdJb [Xanthomonadales bacterium]